MPGSDEGEHVGESGDMDLPDEELTPRWTMFLVQAAHFAKSLESELKKMNDALDDQDTEQDKVEDMITDIEDMEQEMKGLELTWKSVMSIEKIDPEKWSVVGDKNRVNRKSIAKMRKRVQKVLGQATGPTAGNGADANNDLVAALRSVTQAPVVNLPKFNGKNAEFAGFKKKFKFMITQLGITEKLWSTHLYEALLPDVQSYVGSKDDWFDKYNELWECLEDKYANRWVLANDTIKNFVYRPLPDAQPEEINNYFYGQVDALKRVMELNMTIEQVGVNIICQSLPDEVARDLRSGLRALHPDKRKYAFTIKEIVKVYNDVISINGMAGTSESIHSTLCLRTGIQPSAGVQPSAGRGQYGSRGRGHNNQPQSNPSSRGKGRGRGRGFSGGFVQQKPRNCMLCADSGQPPTVGHAPWDCQQYSTPVQIRERLQNLNLCMACAGRVHAGDCPPQVVCAFHTGARHRIWTCAKQGGHPGKQEPSSL